ncbi:MAG: pyridine nucleotide-disulfide oxidoreductase/dicluster-binding protein [bacterium]
MEQRELRELENKCIQEEPPWCTAACPVHVDVRAFNKEIGKGNLATAFKILAKAVVFPRIIGHICDHPCESRCKRNEIDAPVSIHELEKYCVKNADAKKRPLPVKQSESRVAVVGGGLCGLTAAVELAKRGYGVTVYEGAPAVGGRLLQLPEEVLPEDVLQGELEILDVLGIETVCNKKIGTGQEVQELRDEYDALFVALPNSPDLDLTPIDKLTLATPLDGVFARGDTAAEAASYIHGVAQGKKAATSIVRYLQGVSLEAERDKEGPYETRLYTNVEGVETVPPVEAQDPVGGYAPAEAEAEARRCMQCECLECVKACEYLKAFGSYPRVYLREIYNNEAIVMGYRAANTLINSCSLCGLCGEVCPNDLDMGEVIKKSREGMVAREKMPPSAHDFPLTDMNFSNSPHFALMKNAPGTDSSRYMFFPGCQLCASMPAYVELAYAYLRNTLPNVGLSLGCCGAPADWVGQRELFNKARETFLEKLKAFGSPTLILACSSCHDIFRQYYPDLAVISLWQIYDQYGIPAENLLELKEKLAVHDACAARHEDAQQEAIRSLLAKLKLDFQELEYSKDKTTCCGFGGLMTFANREVAIQAIDRRIKESPAPYLVYCAMCKDRFSWRAKETYHILDLIYGGIHEGDPAGLHTKENIGFSQKRENRARLKEKMLKELWGEEMVETGTQYPYELEIEPEARRKMEDRLILKDDILKVIHQAETTGNKMLNKDTGHYFAYYKPVAVTYWVEYSVVDNIYHIHNVYSHRMVIGEG